MENRVGRVLLAKVGAIVFTGALLLPSALSGGGAQASTAMVAGAAGYTLPADPLGDGTGAYLELPEAAAPVSRSLSLASASAFHAEPPATAVASSEAAPQPAPEPVVVDGVVVASWYGPGFFGNLTACGQTYTPEILGVAHRTLPCGTPIRITSPAGVTVVAPVIDRGPFIAGRSLDLSSALKAALSCSDLCHVRMAVLR